MLGIDWLRREDLRTRQTLLVIIGIDTGGNPQLPKIIHASRVISLGLGSAQRGQQQARQDRDDGDHNKQFNESKGATRGREGGWVARSMVRFVRSKRVCFHSVISGRWS